MPGEASNAGEAARRIREAAVLEMLKEIEKRCGWDCVIAGYNGWSLQLLSGACPEYALPLAEFDGVEYLESAFMFSHPTFRIAEQVERDRIGMRTPLDEDRLVFAIDADTNASMDHCTFYIVAEAVRLSMPSA